MTAVPERPVAALRRPPHAGSMPADLEAWQRAVPGAPVLPPARGPLSRAVLDCVTGARPAPEPAPPIEVSDPLSDDDLNLALYLCYELHYRGLPGVDDAVEWDPDLLRLRSTLERRFESALRAARTDSCAPQEVPERLRAIAAEDARPSLSRHMEREATLEQFREFLIHRSAYHLKEADPHSFAIPRLVGEAKAALIEVQADEYGGGRAPWMHSTLFARSMAALGLNPTYGAYLERIPGWTLATVNLMSLFGLHRRLRGALVGQLALFEMTSTMPNRRYASGLRRVGAGDEEATRFFDEHVEADAVHEAIASNDLAGSLVRDEPNLVQDVLWGARAQQLLEANSAREVVGRWRSGRTSLRLPR
jgi:Iron-containing redox enzyme